MTLMVTVGRLVPSSQVKLSPCIDSCTFAMVAVVVKHGEGPAIKVKTIVSLSLVSLTVPALESVTEVKLELSHNARPVAKMQVMVTFCPGRKLAVLLNVVMEPLQKFAMGIPPPAQCTQNNIINQRKTFVS